MDREYPDRPIVGVGAIIFREDDVLLIKRGKAPKKGQWSLPGGAQETGETAAEALVREVREETGAEIAIGGFVEVVDLISEDDKGRVHRHYTLLDYWGDWLAGELRAGGDADDAVWAAKDDLADYGLWDKTAEVIETARRMRAASGPAGMVQSAAAKSWWSGGWPGGWTGAWSQRTIALPFKLKLPVLEVTERPHSLAGHLKAFGVAALFGLSAYAFIMALIFITKWVGMG